MKLKIMVAWSRKNGKIVTLTNATPETHTALALSAYTAAMKRLGKKWGVTAEQAAEKVTGMFVGKNGGPVSKER